jgi:hypothetical protein
MAKKKISNKAPKPSFRNGAVIRTERGWGLELQKFKISTNECRRTKSRN